jgi:hypothetical protein
MSDVEYGKAELPQKQTKLYIAINFNDEYTFHIQMKTIRAIP